MIQIRWSSMGQACAADAQVAPIVDDWTLETLFDQWQAAPNQCDFMASLPLDQAGALCRVILDRVPRGTPTKHARRAREK